MNASITINYAELAYALLPEIALAVGLLIVLGFDIVFGRRMSDSARSTSAIIIGLITLAVATFQAALSSSHAFGAMLGNADLSLFSPISTLSSSFSEQDVRKEMTLFYGMFKPDQLGFMVRFGVFILSALSLPLIAGYASRFTTRKPRSTIRSYPAEYTAVLLLATMGFSLMAVSNNLLVAFLGFELASFSLYIMAGFDKSSRVSAEAGLIYFFFGGMAAAFMLLGFSFIYGLTGSLTFSDIAQTLAHNAVSNEMPLAMQGLDPLMLVALVLVLVGFGYKAAAAPFHFWAPDVYQGAPAPAGALIASASKLAGFAFFARLLYGGLAHASGSFDSLAPAGWVMVLILISAASILLGNLVALAQTNIRRLIAYSAIAHAGAMLIGVVAMRSAGPAPLFYYAFTYGLATIGIFGVFAVIGRTASCQRISDLEGLWKRSPFLSAVLFICVLSLAGIPPLAGFFGKFYVFAAALSLSGLASPLGWLVLLAIVMSAVALYYYLIILKTALVTNPPAETDASDEVGASAAGKIPVPVAVGIALVIICALIIGLGIFPSAILQLFQ